MNYKPIEVAIALSLYAYNVSPHERAAKLHAHFAGKCMDLLELTHIVGSRGAYLATELPFPTAEVYVHYALERYGQEARDRVAATWPVTLI